MYSINLIGLTDLIDSFIENKSYLISGFCALTSTGAGFHPKFQFLRPKAYNMLFMYLFSPQRNF